ncbi:MAG: histidine--tRNA ligase [Candidatus Bathyarchaeota archaeon]|nr:histidine--tRNA ligase [Candidatus Bathyarchaeota archaeon]
MDSEEAAEMFQPARGTRDFLPEEMMRRNWVLDRFREAFEAYGYEPLGTPAFESWEMLSIKSGEDILNQIYYFRDKSDRELGLRFEWTASLCRVVSSHRELPKPFKRYAIGPVWRYERPSESRFREFWQADVDVVGVADPIADAEVIAVAVDCLRRVGFEGFLIRLNDRRILEAAVELAGLPAERSLDVFRAVDKLNKIGEEGVKEELARIGATKEESEDILKLTDLRGEPGATLEETREIMESLPVGLSGCDVLSAIAGYAAAFGIEAYMVVDLSLARGLDYYTGPVYEIYAEGFEEHGSIAGGGRYDELVELFGGEATPATGISLGVERIVPLLEKKEAFKGLDLGPSVYVAAASDSVRAKAIEVAQMLRRSGVAADLDLMGRSLTRQLDYANRKGFKRAVIVGERELREGCVAVRNMETAEQRTVRLEELTVHL